MTPLLVLTLYPLWAVSLVGAITTLRLGRHTRGGLLVLCLMLAGWVSVLVIARLAAAPIAERVVPAGMLLAGGFAHAAHDLGGGSTRWMPIAFYVYGAAVAVLGALAPGWLYAPGLRATGPLFWPILVVSAASVFWLFAWIIRAALAVSGPERRRRLVLAGSQVCAALGGGVAIAANILLGIPLEAAALPLLVAALLIGYVIVSGEHGRSRRLLAQGLVYAALTAALSAVGLSVFFLLLPSLLPSGTSSIAWLVAVTFLAALPLDPLRMLIVENIGRRLFPDPIGTLDLVAEVDRGRERADHAEHLAEIGTLASAVAHEIRNPLGVIAAHAKLLERAGADGESVTALRAEVDRARRFLDDLLRFSKPRPLDLGTVVVSDALSAAIQAVRQTAPEGWPTVDLDVEGASALVVEADPAAFHDVHVVLLDNAVAALGDAPDRHEVRIRAREIQEPLASVEVVIEDDGPGVPAEIEHRLFQPFVTGRGRDARRPGTGLGLATAARWLERHGGTLRHERPSKGGARFILRWPLRSRVHG
jgi:signal transduction histidine kinase